MQFAKKTTAEGWYFTSEANKSVLAEFAKKAFIGGEPEANFEQSMSSLAFHYIKDKSPKLIPYMVGFQLYDRQDDNKQAFGAFGFRIGKMVILVPIVFRNGELNGHEMMVVPASKLIAPLKDNWVNKVIQQSDGNLGFGVKSTENQKKFDYPSFRGLLYSAKNASYSGGEPQPWAVPYFVDMLKRVTKSADLLIPVADKSAKLDVVSLIADPHTVPLYGSLKKAKATLDTHPELIAPIYLLGRRVPSLDLRVKKAFSPSVYTEYAAKIKAKESKLDLSPETLRKQAAELLGVNKYAADADDKKHPLRSGGMQIAISQRICTTSDLSEMSEPQRRDMLKKLPDDISDVVKQVMQYAEPSDTKTACELTDQDRQQLWYEPLMIKDARTAEEISKITRVNSGKSFYSPSLSGRYEVLMAGGKTKTFDVFCDFLSLKKPSFLAEDCFGPPSLGGDKLFGVGNRSSAKVLLVDVATKDYTITDAARVLVCSLTMFPDAMFKARKPVPTSEDDLYSDKDSIVLAKGRNNAVLGPFIATPSADKNSYVIRNRDDSPSDIPYKTLLLPGMDKTTYNSSVLTLDSSWKFMTLGKNTTLALGNDKDIIRYLSGNTLKIKKAGDNYKVNDKTLSRLGTQCRLMLIEGLSVHDATDLMKEAATQEVHVRVEKKAELYPEYIPSHDPEYTRVGIRDILQSRNHSDDVPLLGREEPEPTTEEELYGSLLPEKKYLSGGGNQAAGATEDDDDFTGAQMLITMARTARPLEVIKDCMSTLVAGMSKYGEILLLSYLHSEDFKDRFGDDSLKDLRRNIKDCFERIGDVTLTLEAKQVDQLKSVLSGLGPQQAGGL